MDKKIIVTIAREYGSGGREIGQKLAKRLGASFYDKELIALAAQESGIDEELFINADEKPINPFWSSLAFNVGSFGNRVPTINDMPMNDRLFLIQSGIIKKVASEGSCVIVGRCADYILDKDPDAVHIFIHADTEDKLSRITHRYGVPEEAARDTMKKTDRRRAAYYDYYVGERWGQIDHYDLAINSSALGIDKTVDLIYQFVHMK